MAWEVHHGWRTERLDAIEAELAEILKKFPWVRNIKQANKGLSYARNVGMNAARGEVIVYTDSDCEADEDWLYYLALALVRSGHVGMGGPNLIPDEGSWVADCVGLSPGGPTHVMVDDRTAEHVPGCNMAFRKRALEEVGGFPESHAISADYLTWFRIALHHELDFVPGPVAHYTVHDAGISADLALCLRARIELFSAAHVTWIGGSTYADMPSVDVQRRTDDGWVRPLGIIAARDFAGDTACWRRSAWSSAPCSTWR